ncbi:MAG: aminotransferase class V-fold PLP-dependent enzyme [Anaerolineae bacterium]|jgi:glutamate/tyrosine decarboxylase-like PLP-dependent enzyme
MVTTRDDVPVEETLDPADWASMRALGHRMLDDMLDHLQTLKDRPVWQHAPNRIKDHFSGPPPAHPQAPEGVYEEYLEVILPHLHGLCHPRFWGWVGGSGTVMGAFADFLASATNSICGVFAYASPNYVEFQVLDWCKTLLGYPASASGQLTAGCSTANLVALAVARNAQAGYDLRREGLHAAPQFMTLYASAEAHSSIQKAIELLGLGGDSLRKVPTNERLEIDLEALNAAIRHDRETGCHPFCVVGAAGTTNTGAIDDLNGLADICQREGLWYHVDGAFGAWAAIAPRAKNLVAGMERADSLALDLHKWMYLPYPIGCVLVRQEENHRWAFSLTPTYLAHGEGKRGFTGEDVPWLSDYGFDLSRGFLALKAWMTIKEQGTLKYGRLIQQNIDQAHYLGHLVEAAPELELALPVSLNIACFRYIHPDLDDPALGALNKEIEIEMQERGIAVPSIVVIQGRKYLHVAITNHRTRREDLDLLVQEVIRLGREFVESGQ